MPSHRLDRDIESGGLQRLSRALGMPGGGWTPAQPPPGDEERHVAGRAPLFAPQASALTWLIIAGLAVLVVSGFLLSRHHGASASAGSVSGASPPASTTLPGPAPATNPGDIVVDVGGRVRHPGLVTLPSGSRVADAIAAAGGALHPADLARINLAAKVTDGQLLLIGVPGASVGDGAGGAAAGPVDLNSATVDQLDALPGVGPVLAQRIVDWRQAHGGFRTVDDLQQVPGIGPSKFDSLKSLVVV
jgi:competence protein ComEA